MRENLDDEITEVKSENAIDRITSQANPRTLERVPAGARFRVRMILDILCEEDKALVPRVIEGLRLLEDDALGGGGSRAKRPAHTISPISRSLGAIASFYSSGGRGSRACLGCGSGARTGRGLKRRVRGKAQLDSWRLVLFIRRLRPHRTVAHLGTDSGDRDRVERVYHSDTLYSAVSSAMDRLGMLEEWLDATASGRSAACGRPQSRFSSCFPFNGETLYVMPAARSVASARVFEGALEGRALRAGHVDSGHARGQTRI